ncbi:MAG: class I SAM-dependent DNA methyltransferase, partial [Armatimonadota bacterium]
MAIFVTEEMLEREVAMYLAERLKASLLEQGSLRRPHRQLDILLRLNDERLVVEMKIGEGWQKIVQGIVQANEYKERLNASGVIALVYPPNIRRPVESAEQARHLALTMPVQALILSTFLNDHFVNIKLPYLAERIADAWANYQQQRVATISHELIVNALRECVQLLSAELRQNRGLADPVVETVVGSFDLFRILAEGEMQPSKQLEKQLQLAALDLAAYVLVNQMLLYRLLEMAIGLPPLRPIERTEELTRYFSAVTRIDYEAVYSVDVADRLPDIPSIRRHINDAIKALTALRPEELPHDLMGRVFHEFLPFETRKLLGAFYTKPQAAELLAGLVIDDPDAVVFDPACGSGTLLVAAYRHKRRLLPLLSPKEQRRKHHEFVERQIYGVDIMPFAAHLAAMNMTLQDVHAKVNYLRIGVGHSLTLTPRAQVGTIASQFSLFEVAEEVDLNNPTPKRGIAFRLPAQVDIVLMNPPFTRMQRLRANMLGNYKTAFLQAQNYWAYFLALADNFLTVGGKIAAVLPRDFLSGGPSQAVRDWLWSSGRYCLRYLVKTTKEVAFSEAARFRDFLVVLEKRNAETVQTLPPCAIVYLKRRLNELELDEAADIARRIKKLQQGRQWDDDDCSVVWLPQEKVRSGDPVFQFYAAFSHPETAETLLEFLETLKEKAGQHLTALTEVVHITRGLNPAQKGVIKAVYAVRPLHPDRLRQSPLVVEEETQNAVVVRFANQLFKIPRASLLPGLKTHAYLPTMDITDNSDWFICRRFKGFDKIELILGAKVDFDALDRRANTAATHLAVGYRLDLAAPGTCLLAFYSERKVVPQQAFSSFHADPEMAKALCLWLNGVAFIVQILANRAETRGSFCNLTNEMLRTTMSPTAQFFTEHDKDFAEAFERFKAVKWRSLLEQFEGGDKERYELDGFLLQTLGFSTNEIAQWLPKVYRA